MTGRHSRARRFDGGGIRLRLVALVLVPLLGVCACLGVVLQGQRASARSAQRVERLIDDITALNQAETTLQQELVPSIAIAAEHSPTLAAALGVTAADAVRLGLTPAVVAGLRHATDQAFAGATGRPALTTSIAAAQHAIRSIRAQIDAGSSDVSTLYDKGLAVGQSLADSESRALTAATAIGVDEATATALADVALVARAVQLGAQQVPLYVASQLPIDPAGSEVGRLKWEKIWGAFTTASDQISSSASGPVRTAWTQVLQRAAVRDFDALSAPSLTSTPVAVPVGLANALTAVGLDTARDKALEEILRLAASRASAAASDRVQQVDRELAVIVGICGLVLVGSAAGLFVAGRSLSRPLGALAARARQVSEGELPEVAVSGPREIRTVGRGLAAAVANLRRIQDQAAAVADGELDSDVINQPLPGRLGQVVHDSVSQIVTAMHARDEAQIELEHLASHDALTELPNRAQALSLIERSLHRAQRMSTSTGLMFVDLDHFKSVNDTHGHGAGDVVLKASAQRMLDVVRDGDTVARLGGDEFVVLLEDVDSEADFVRLAERLIEALSAPIPLDGKDVHVGASVGVAICRDAYVDASRLLNEADAAVYEAKASGRGRVGIFDDDLREALAERSAMEHAITYGLEHDEFELHYQPVVDLGSGRTLGVEALIRWERPGYGMVGPNDFIPVAELSSLIDDIGRWALLEATTQLAEWTEAGSDAAELTVAVNISGRHLTSNFLLADVRAALAESGIAPQRLVIEVTETVLVDDPIATSNLQALQAMGVQVAIDDFGTGFTSIGQLPRLPVDTLKIDRSFVASPDPAHQELVKLIVSAAHAFGLAVVAEGVEHAHQADALRSAAAEVGQGYLFARPLPAHRLDPTSVHNWAAVVGAEAG